MRALLIVNPNATSTTPAARDLLAHALESRVQLTVEHTEHRGHAAELARWATAEHLDLVVVHGGDGTVNETVNGMLPTPRLLDTDGPAPLLAVLPGGSANVFARSLGIDPDPVVATNQLLDLLALDAHRAVGLGYLPDPGPESEGRWFTFNAGLGLDAVVCEAIDKARAKGHTATPARYVRTTVRAFLGAQRSTPTLTVELPGHDPVPDIHYAMVSNSSPWTYLDRRPVRTNPGTSFDSGLGLFAMRSVRVIPTLRMARQLLSNNDGPTSPWLVRNDDVPKITIRSTTPLGLQMDGDYLGKRDVAEFTAVPAALQVVAPKIR